MAEKPDDDTVPAPKPVELPSIPLTFARWAFAVAGLVAFTTLMLTFLIIGKHANDDLPHQLSLPLITCGVLLVASGVAMASVDWRSAYKETAKQHDLDDTSNMVEAAKLVEALGKLRGGTLILIAGLVLLLGCAWVAANAAEAGTGSRTGSPPPGSPGPVQRCCM